MKKTLVHGKSGFVATGLVNAGKVEFIDTGICFAEGNANSTIGNIMFAVAKTIELFLESEADTSETLAVAMPSVVADKLNSDIFLKEHLTGKLIGKGGRDLNDRERQVYAYLTRVIGASYGRVLFVSQQFIAKNVTTAKNDNQKEWAMIFNEVKNVVDGNLGISNQPEAVGDPLPF